MTDFAYAGDQYAKSDRRKKCEVYINEAEQRGYERAKDEWAKKDEREITQVIEERDQCEQVISDLYQSVMGEPPEWSNHFGYRDAVEDVTDYVHAIRTKSLELANAEQRARAEQAEDAARLDWLEKDFRESKCLVIEGEYKGYQYKTWDYHNPGELDWISVDGTETTGKTLRAAIDAARGVAGRGEVG
ncbi:hypothetical protein J2D73_20075 [Acetobacter sacchari]|uniref:Uncharacterized protein n=1 Tax=Acetobacter sacchari TaxID=2661687 RepID=A0ABS3M1P8_9PROT|nr:hypothetical protein [Acetobacter sacchari]MBO1362078.1 hypothetical protein [Acetobacter sacchari]